MKTALITHDDCLHHVTPPGHPEQVARLEYIHDALNSLDVIRVEAELARKEDIATLHPITYIEKIEAAVPDNGWASIDGDTHLSPGSFQAALRAAGGVLQAVDLVMSQTAQNAFVAVRPPGHHAEKETAMGFCFFGNVALGVKHALDYHGLSRVAVVDFDVHHGNGTQDLLWHEPRALTITSHQSPLWPGTGSPHERGAHDNVMNVPLHPGSDGFHMRGIYEREVLPRLEAFAPEFLFISAGFDAHRADPLAELNWSEDDFVWLTRKLSNVAAKHAKGRLVSVLEGGYDLSALAASVKAHVETLCEVAK
ncbi:MAG: histone deacetylase family protein [Paracoccaceae bacterium]